MAYDYVKKDASSVIQNNEAGGQAAQLKKSHSNASMASMLGEGDFSVISSFLEAASGVSLGDVEVHYNSHKPAAIGALAYAKGNEVFLGPGQEQHLPHELTHVVQQKQGIVEPTGNIGGMPVNTSDSLESAADRMSTAVPSGAVSGATPSGGVVQGIFISESMNNGRVPKEDVEAAIKMLEGAYQSHIDEMEKIKKANDTDLKNAATGDSANALKAKMRGDKKLLQAYKNGKSSVRSRFKEKIKSEDKVYIEAYLQDELYKAQQMGYNAAQEGAGLTDNAYDHLSDAGKTVVDPERKLKSEHTLKGFLRDMSRFALDDTVFEGLDGVKDWSPAFDAGALTQVRMGGSASLTGNIGDGTATKTATNKQLTKMKKQFTKSTEISRKAALEIRSNKYKNVGFAFLYNLLQDLNKTVQEGMDSGGKLRAAHATAGLISSVGQNQLPEDLYRLLNKIGSYIRIIGDMQDEKLRKSQAIRVASFSYQMLISLHPFRDGNGRTCRLFSDTVLQAFGLPPHTPLTMNLGGTVGENGDNEYRPQIDFEKGSYAYLYAVRESSRILSGQKRSIPSDYEYLRKKDEPMPRDYATGEGYGNLTLDQRQRIWNDYKQGLQEEMNLDVSQREEREVKELRRKQKQMEEWKKNPELKQADLELQARQDDYRNDRRSRRRAAMGKGINSENYKKPDKISVGNIINNIINNEEDEKSGNELLKSSGKKQSSGGRKIEYKIVKGDKIDKNTGKTVVTADEYNHLKENSGMSEKEYKWDNYIIVDESDNFLAYGSEDLNRAPEPGALPEANQIDLKESILNISGKDEDILIIDENKGNPNIISLSDSSNNINNEDKKPDIKNVQQKPSEKDEDPAVLDINHQKMKDRTPQSLTSKVRNVSARTFGNVVSNAAFLLPMGVSALWLLKKKHDLKKLYSSEGRTDERRTHDIIPGWNGARFSDMGQQEPDKDILDDFRRVPTVWARPIMEPADTKNGYGTKDTLLPPKVIAYCAQPRSYSSSSIERVLDCGHAFLGIEFSQYSKITGRNQRYRIKCGFYPAKTSENKVAGAILGKNTIGVGEVCDDTNHVYDISRTYTSSRANIKAMAEKAEKYTEEGGYGWYTRNCVTFLRDTLKAGNLDGDTVDKVFTEEIFRFGAVQNTGFAAAEDLLTSMNLYYHYKMLRYGKEDDITYQGQGNKRMTGEEYKRWQETYNSGGYGQKGWIPASVAENLRRLDDKSLMGSYNHVSDEYKQKMATINDTKVEGNARDLQPDTVQALLFFADDDGGEIKRTGDKLKTSIKTIIADDIGTQILNDEKDESKKWSEVDKWLRDRGKEYENFRGWLNKYITDPSLELKKIVSYVKETADKKIEDWKKKNPNYENDPKLKEKLPEYKKISLTDCLTNLPQDVLDKVYNSLKKALIDVNKHYAVTLQYDARVHREVMDYLSTLQMSIKLVETLNENKHYDASQNKGDLGSLLIDSMTKNMKVSISDWATGAIWERYMSPSQYEAFLQVYGSPGKVMEALKKKKELDDSKETGTSEYHKLSREHSLARDYQHAHRYLLNKKSFTRADMQYTLDLKKKEKDHEDKYSITIDRSMSDTYLAVFFENIFGGVKEKLKADNTIEVPDKIEDLNSNEPIIDKCADWLANHYRDKAQKNDAKSQIRIFLRCLKGSAVIPEEHKKIDLLVAHFGNFLSDSFTKKVFPPNLGGEKTKENLFRNNISYISSRVMDKERPLYPIILQCAKDVFITEAKDDDNKNRFEVGNISNKAGLATAIEGLSRHVADDGKSKNAYTDYNIAFDKIMKAKERLSPYKNPHQANVFWQPRNEAEKQALTYIASQKAKLNGYPQKKGQCPLYAWQLRFLRPEIKTELAKYVNI